MSDASMRLTAALADRYRIERELGQGGMATVYLAQDLKHDRKVAIKVLRPELAAVIGADRFLSEIKTTANLQHPHILPLFDSGAADSFLFYVMPFIEGESLRDRLNREKQLPIADAVRIATEVAGALDYAHRHNVIHRDIKPENILLHDGRALVADFGIALAASKAGGTRMTETGMSLGTPTYMSPEQAMGEREITARSDVYALGCITYEMLVGDPPFTGSTAQAIVAKVMTEKPAPPSRMRDRVPAQVEEAVLTALEKLPADRFSSAAQFAEALANTGFTISAGTSSKAGAGVRHSWRRAIYLAAGAGALLLAAIASSGRFRTPSQEGLTDAPLMHLRLAFVPGDRIAAPNSDDLGNGGRPSRTAFAFSPDGQSLVITGARDGVEQLFLRPLAGEAERPIPGTEGAESPFFSPDGAFLGFWVNGKLRRLPLAGGPATDIIAIDRIAGASWGEDDRIVVGQPTVGLILLSATGASPPDTLAGVGAALPQFLPGDKAILYTDLRDYLSPPRIELLSLGDRTSHLLIENGADARFLATGHLIFARRGTLLAVPFEPAKRIVSARPIVVLDDVMQALDGNNTGVLTGAAQVALSPLGQLAYLSGGVTAPQPGRLVWLDRQGRRTPIAAAGSDLFFAVRLSPDGSRLAVSVYGERPHLLIVDLARQSARTLETEVFPLWPLWTPDGERVLRTGKDHDSIALVWSPADGSRPAEPVLRKPVLGKLPAFWSADGSELFTMNADNRLAAVTLATGAERLIEHLPTGLAWPTLSPDGKWLAYGTRDGATGEVSIDVQPWPGLESRVRVSGAGGGVAPVWTKGGRELTYLQDMGSDSTGTNRSRVMVVESRPGPGFVPLPARELFTTGISSANPIRSYDVTADGMRFVATEYRAVSRPAGEIHVVVNWFAELRRLTTRQEGRP